MSVITSSARGLLTLLLVSVLLVNKADASSFSGRSRLPNRPKSKSVKSERYPSSPSNLIDFIPFAKGSYLSFSHEGSSGKVRRSSPYLPSPAIGDRSNFSQSLLYDEGKIPVKNVQKLFSLRDEKVLGRSEREFVSKDSSSNLKNYSNHLLHSSSDGQKVFGRSSGQLANVEDSEKCSQGSDCRVLKKKAFPHIPHRTKRKRTAHGKSRKERRKHRLHRKHNHHLRDEKRQHRLHHNYARKEHRDNIKREHSHNRMLNKVHVNPKDFRKQNVPSEHSDNIRDLYIRSKHPQNIIKQHINLEDPHDIGNPDIDSNYPYNIRKQQFGIEPSSNIRKKDSKHSPNIRRQHEDSEHSSNIRKKNKDSEHSPNIRRQQEDSQHSQSTRKHHNMFPHTILSTAHHSHHHLSGSNFANEKAHTESQIGYNSPAAHYHHADEADNSVMSSGRARRYLDDNNYLPEFRKTSYRATVDEDVAIGSSVLSVYASDDDVNEMGIVNYSTDDDHFEVDEGGEVYTVKRLDFEGSGGRYDFNVYAYNPGMPPNLWTSVPATLRVRNTKEPPEFDSDRYEFSVSEFSEKGEYVGRVVAWDPEGGAIRYRLMGEDPPGVFVINPNNGIISVGDRSQADAWTYNFKAIAQDPDSSSSDVIVTVKIKDGKNGPKYARRVFYAATDENTNLPIFEECHTYQNFQIPENQSVPYNVIMVEATDKDHGIHGQVTYSLLGENTDFTIDSRSGQISTTKPLDRDSGIKEYYITVLASDGGNPPLEGSCSFEVILSDVNDNAPLFDREVISQDIPVDSEVNINLLRVTASDADTGRNAEIEYSISNTEGYFDIDPTTGYIKLTKPLEQNMANIKTFDLLATATDGGEPPLSVSARVRIIVVSSDQMAPSVVERDPSPQVFEDAEVGTTVAQLCAKSNTLNPEEVYFNLISGNSPAMNGEGTFDIRKDVAGTETSCPPNTVGATIYVTVKNINYEEITTYKLIIQVSNLNARIDHSMTVKVRDVNDEMPLLQPPLSGVISENSDANSLVMTITAVDKDVSKEFRTLTYSIADDAGDEIKRKFRIDSINGQLWTLQSLDREERKNYGVNVAVTDGKMGHERSTMYWISINDVNDEPPKFNRELGNYTVVIPEDLEVGKNTGILLKVDDKDEVNDFSFQIVSGNEADKFSIDRKTGEITVNKKLDYDSPVNDRTFHMSVTVSDGRNYDTTDIEIEVSNVNDLRPVFEPHYYNITIQENFECDVKKVQVKAYDPDLSPNVDQNIRYYLSMEQTKNFSLDSITGWFSVKGCLDREATPGGIEKINPRADDGGGHGINAEPGVIEVTILDVNDNHPHIKYPDESKARVRENLPPEIIPPIPIQLDDLDAPENGCPCTLKFDPNTDPLIPTLFQVSAAGESSKYELRVLQQLDREAQKFYNIPFQTRDTKGLSGIRFLTIEVDDVNDSPMFDGESKISVYNFEGQFPDILVGSVYVRDADDHDVDDKTFEVDPATSSEAEGHFSVDRNSGNITMLAGTPPGIYELIVKVTDHFRKEEAFGKMEITVLNLPEEAVRQSGSFVVLGFDSHTFIQKNKNGLSVFDVTRDELGGIYGVEAKNVDIFGLTDVAEGVIVRFNCHGSPYFTQPRLNGLLLQNKAKLEDRLNASIPIVDTNRCMYEQNSPCFNSSCSMSLKINGTHPDVIRNEDATLVGVFVEEYYACTCYDYQQGGVQECNCLNGGQCRDPSNPNSCTCPDDFNYGPKCELLTARFNGVEGFAWFESIDTCENSLLSVTFETDVNNNGVIVYNGPIVTKPYYNYPGDFLYIYLKNRKVIAYLDLGSGTMVLSVNIGKAVVDEEEFTVIMSWNQHHVTLEVKNCLGSNSTNPSPAGFCRTSKSLSGDISPSFLFNTGSPLQLGGIAPMSTFQSLAGSYKWTEMPELIDGFRGCVKKLQFNDRIYDMNSTDYFSEDYYHRTCSIVRIGPLVKLGRESIAIIVTSLLLLLLLLLILIILARRSKRQPSYPENLQFVNETMGPSNVEGFGEKDATRFDLNMLRVTPDGQLIGGEKPHKSDVATSKPVGKAPTSNLPDGLCIGDYIGDTLKKVDEEPENLDSVRHYCYEGDAMSIASLSSIGSSSTTSESQDFKDLNEWGPKFGKLNNMYGPQACPVEEDSEFNFPTLPKDSARKMRRMRFNPELTGPIYPGAERIYGGTLPIYGADGYGPGGSNEGVPSSNPMAGVYPENGGSESWC